MNIDKNKAAADMEAILADSEAVKQRPLSGAPHLLVAKRKGRIFLTKLDSTDTIVQPDSGGSVSAEDTGS